MKTKLRLNSFLLGVALLAGSCSGLNIPGGNSTTSSNDSKTSEASVQPSGDPREDVRKALTALLAAKSWRARLTISGMGVLVIEFLAPDRFHTKGEPNPTEMIIVGQDTFVREGDGPWYKSPANISFGAIVQQVRKPDVAQEMAKYVEIKSAGSEVLDGAPMLVYRFKRSDENGQRSGRIWIGANDGLPHKLENEEADPNGDGKKTMEVTYDYAADIKIEPPI